MNTAWFIALGFLLIGYAIFDGFDLGVGHRCTCSLGKDDAERRTNFNVIGPFWFGYEVWLLVAGGSMVAAFPRLYAASFSGFYLVLMLVLWLLDRARLGHRVPQPRRRPAVARLLGLRLLRGRARCWPCCSAPPSATSSGACRWTRPATSKARSPWP